MENMAALHSQEQPCFLLWDIFIGFVYPEVAISQVTTSRRN
jgi:hypothetical protein